MNTILHKKHSKRSLFATLCTLLFSLCLVLPIFADTNINLDDIVIENESEISGDVYDSAGLLTNDEISSLSDKLAKIENQYQCDVAVLTLNNINGYDVEDYTDAIFFRRGYGYGSNKDCVMFTISMADRDWRLLTYGFGATAVSNEYGFDYITNRVVSKLSDGDYYDAFNTFADLTEAFLREAREGTPYSDDNPAKLTFLSRALPYLMSFGIAFIVALIICSVKAASMKTAVKKTSAADYMEPGSFHLTKKRDYYLYTTTQRIKREKQESSSDGGGGGGGHVDSHGCSGGSGKF